MEKLLGFDVSGWDYLTFLAMFIIGVAFLALVIFILGLPGRIAIARNHPDADAVNAMGWVGFLAVVPWIQAFIWAFKPTTIIDIRYLPEEERRETAAMIARLKGKAAAADAEHPPDKVGRRDRGNSHTRYWPRDLLACFLQAQVAQAHPRLGLRLCPGFCALFSHISHWPEVRHAQLHERYGRAAYNSAHSTLARTYPRDRRVGRRKYASEEGPAAVPVRPAPVRTQGSTTRGSTRRSQAKRPCTSVKCQQR